MTHVVLGRWGKNLAIRFPNNLARDLGLHEGELVEVDAAQDHIVIRRTRPRYNLDDLFAGKSADEWRVTYADAYDWGPDVGRESIEE